MGRIYRRKTEKGADGVKYTREQLNQAREDVLNGNITVYAAAKRYNVPRTTLRHHINGTRGVKGIAAENGKGGGGKLALDLLVEKKWHTIKRNAKMGTWTFKGRGFRPSAKLYKKEQHKNTI